MNEGCWNCGTIEEYNGGDNDDIRYLCGVCVACGIVLRDRGLFEEMEAEKKQPHKSVLRVRKKRGKEKVTIGTC